MTEPSTRRQRGRPKWSLRNDPERYLIAYYMARTMALPVASETALARHIIQTHYSEIGSADKAKAFASAILERETIRFKPKRDMLKGHDDPEWERWRTGIGRTRGRTTL